MHYLIIYWLIFWQKFLRNPYLLSTSEIASTYFPFWRWMGKHWSIKDKIYYKYPGCIPFLSMWYFPSYIVSKTTKHLSIDVAYRCYIYFILSHYLIASLLAYKVMGLFGALTLTYAGYCIKPQTPSFVYSIAWMPGILLGGSVGAFCLGMTLLSGYWPIQVYFLPVALFLHPETAWGFLIALPQIIAFLWYWPKSVRSGEKVDRNFGRLPIWKLKDLFWTSNSVGLVNGVHYPEVEMYMGISVLFIWKASFLLLPLAIFLLVCLGYFPGIQRIPSRTLYVITFLIALVISEVSYKGKIADFLVVLQSFFLYRNSFIYPSFPFSQWWDKPSKLYSSSMNGTWPNVTGYLINQSISSYKGAFSLK